MSYLHGYGGYHGSGGGASSIQSLLTQLQSVSDPSSDSFDPEMRAHAALEYVSQISERLSFVQNGQTRQRDKQQATSHQSVWRIIARSVSHSLVSSCLPLPLLLSAWSSAEDELSGVRVADLCRTLVSLLAEQGDSPDLMRQEHTTGERRERTAWT